ncbi:hypothetical protein CVT24_010474 [Panaeolus cyanescens]|uniref:Brl1/Brr6 domain-containing protein n=1 Tax=Panaeolus cyanescens TaxID=181874 RepID=A0A409WAW4_9AGAR|nr:hypothetical protein CVT24_010474 [Panaeolus cyanescens]
MGKASRITGFPRRIWGFRGTFERHHPTTFLLPLVRDSSFTLDSTDSALSEQVPVAMQSSSNPECLTVPPTSPTTVNQCLETPVDQDYQDQQSMLPTTSGYALPSAELQPMTTHIASPILITGWRASSTPSSLPQAIESLAQNSTAIQNNLSAEPMSAHTLWTVTPSPTQPSEPSSPFFASTQVVVGNETRPHSVRHLSPILEPQNPLQTTTSKDISHLLELPRIVQTYDRPAASPAIDLPVHAHPLFNDKHLEDLAKSQLTQSPVVLPRSRLSNEVHLFSSEPQLLPIMDNATGFLHALAPKSDPPETQRHDASTSTGNRLSQPPLDIADTVEATVLAGKGEEHHPYSNPIAKRFSGANSHRTILCYVFKSHLDLEHPPPIPKDVIVQDCSIFLHANPSTGTKASWIRETVNGHQQWRSLKPGDRYTSTLLDGLPASAGASTAYEEDRDEQILNNFVAETDRDVVVQDARAVDQWRRDDNIGTQPWECANRQQFDATGVVLRSISDVALDDFQTDFALTQRGVPSILPVESLSFLPSMSNHPARLTWHSPSDTQRQRQPQKRALRLQWQAQVNFIPSIPSMTAFLRRITSQPVFTLIISMSLYYLIVGIITVQREVYILVQQQKRTNEFNIALCNYEYLTNYCDKDWRPPAMTSKCREWEFSDVINGFTQRLTIRSFLFMGAAFALMAPFLSNLVDKTFLVLNI